MDNVCNRRLFSFPDKSDKYQQTVSHEKTQSWLARREGWLLVEGCAVLKLFCEKKSSLLVPGLQWSHGEILIPVAEISLVNRPSQSYHMNMTILFFQEFAGRQRSREPEQPD